MCQAVVVRCGGLCSQSLNERHVLGWQLRCSSRRATSTCASSGCRSHSVCLIDRAVARRQSGCRRRQRISSGILQTGKLTSGSKGSDDRPAVSDGMFFCCARVARRGRSNLTTGPALLVTRCCPERFCPRLAGVAGHALWAGRARSSSRFDVHRHLDHAPGYALAWCRASPTTGPRPSVVAVGSIAPVSGAPPQFEIDSIRRLKVR